MSESETDGDDFATAIPQQSEVRVLSACRDCGFVAAVKVEDYDEMSASDNDPAFRHYDSTGHRVGSFEPGSEFLIGQWEIAFGLGDYSELREDLYEVAAGLSEVDE